MADEEPRWQFEKVGMTYRCWSDVLGTTLYLAHLKRSRGELTGLLTITTRLKTKTNSGTLHASKFNVMSSTSRNSLARLLATRTPGMDMDWFDALETLCQSVIVAEATGEPMHEVGLDAPRPRDQQFLVYPVILKGEVSIVFGPGGVGKSLIALTCGLSVACGREIIPGIAPAVHGHVLYLDWETQRATVNDRIVAIAKGHGFDPSTITYRRCVRPLADDAEELSAIVAERKTALVIVDSSGYAQGTQGEYGDANESVLRIHDALRLIGTSSLIVDHVAKTDIHRKAGTATPYGSGYKLFAARIAWEVRKEASATGLRIALYNTKGNDAALLPPIGIALDWTHDRITFRADVVGPEEEETGPDTSDAIRDLLADGAKMQLGEIARLLDPVPYNTVKSAVRRMVDRGEVVRDEAGWYSPVKMPLKFRTAPGSKKGLDA